MNGATRELLATSALLWPSPAEIVFTSDRTPAPGRRTLLLVPNARRPRMLVPIDKHRASAAAAFRLGASGSLLARTGRWAYSGLLLSGLAERVLRDRILLTHGPRPEDHEGATPRDIEGYLASVLGTPVVVGVRFGVARANAKPLVQVLDRGGRTIAFAKIGHTTMTKDLVRNEAAALQRLAGAGLRQVEIPQVLEHTTWEGLEVMTISALPAGRNLVNRLSAPPLQAMVEVALHRSGTGSVGEGAHWARLRAAAASVHDARQRAGLDELFDTIARRWGGVELTTGAWHGDWAPWNMSRRGRRVLVWDWERYAEEVPIGFDALHHRVQVLRFKHHLSWQSMTKSVTDEAYTLLQPFGVSGPGAESTAVLYLLDLCLRYMIDAQGPSGAVLRPTADQLFEALVSNLSSSGRNPSGRTP